MKSRREKLDFDVLIVDLLDRIPEEMYISSETTFLDISCSSGQITRKIEQRLKDYGHSSENINKRIFGIERYQIIINYLMNKYRPLGTYVAGDVFAEEHSNILFKEILESKYDVIISNPEYNKPSTKIGRGSLGDTTLYKRYYRKSKTLLKLNGYLSFIAPKGIISHLISDDREIRYVNLMTSQNYWRFNTCHFSIKNTKKSSDFVFEIEDVALNKIYTAFNPNWYELRSLSKNSKALEHKNGIRAITKLPTANSPIEYSYINPSYTKLLNAGPKLCSNLFFCKHSFITTEEPFCAENSCAYRTATLEEAKKLKLFVLNNKVFNAIFKKLKPRGLFWTLRNVKPFDINQIQTGHEIPKEWNLTKKEIEFILQ